MKRVLPRTDIAKQNSIKRVIDRGMSPLVAKGDTFVYICGFASVEYIERSVLGCEIPNNALKGALSCAVEYERVETVEWLVGRGADPFGPGDALDVFIKLCRFGNLEVAEAFVRGREVPAGSFSRALEAIVTAKHNQLELFPEEHYTKVAFWLIERGATPFVELLTQVKICENRDLAIAKKCIQECNPSEGDLAIFLKIAAYSCEYGEEVHDIVDFLLVDRDFTGVEVSVEGYSDKRSLKTLKALEKSGALFVEKTFFYFAVLGMIESARFVLHRLRSIEEPITACKRQCILDVVDETFAREASQETLAMLKKVMPGKLQDFIAAEVGNANQSDLPVFAALAAAAREIERSSSDQPSRD